MSRIDFKPIALPSFDSALELYKQSGTGLQNVFKDLASTFSGLETEVKAKNDAAIKDFINQAATTQALQSPEFQQQLQAKQQELGGVYTPEAISAYRDSRVDTLNKRAADALQMQSNQYAYDRGLLTDQRTDSTLRAAQQLATGNGTYKDLVNDPNVDPVSLLGLQTNLNASSTLEGTKKAIALLASGASIQQALAASPNADPAAVIKMFQDSRTAESTLATNEVARREAQQRINAGEFNLGIQKQLGAALNGDTGAVIETPLGTMAPSKTYTSNKARWDAQKSVLASRFGQISSPMKAAAEKYGLPVELIMATSLVESGAAHTGQDGKLTSSGKAYGIMQLIPATAARFGATNIADLNQNIDAGAKYLRFLYDKYKGDLPRVIAAYNAGEGNVDRYKGIPPFAETQEYVPKVLDAIRWLSEIGGNARSVGGIDPSRIGAGSSGLTLEAAPKAGAGGLTVQDIMGEGGALNPGSAVSTGRGSGRIDRNYLFTRRADLTEKLTQLKQAFDSSAAKPPTSTKYMSWGEWLNEVSDGWFENGFQAKAVKDAIEGDERFKGLPQAEQIRLADSVLQKTEADNFTPTRDWAITEGRRKDYANQAWTEYQNSRVAPTTAYRNNMLTAYKSAVTDALNYAKSFDPTVTPRAIADYLGIPDKDQLELGYISKEDLPSEESSKPNTPANNVPVTVNNPLPTTGVATPNTPAANKEAVPNKPVEGTTPTKPARVIMDVFNPNATGYMNITQLKGQITTLKDRHSKEFQALVDRYQKAIRALTNVGRHREAAQLYAKLGTETDSLRATRDRNIQIMERAIETQEAAIKDRKEKDKRKQQELDAQAALRLLNGK